MFHSFSFRLHSPFWRALAVLLLSLFFFSACVDRAATETSMFEAAELHYRDGNYGEALIGYQDFLRRYPASPLTDTAEMRVRNIQREVSSLMERSGSPRPVYHGSRSDQREAEVEIPPEFLVPRKESLESSNQD